MMKNKITQKLMLLQLAITMNQSLGYRMPMTMYTFPSSGTSRIFIPESSSSPYMYNSNIPKSSRISQQEQFLLEERTNSLLSTPLPLPPEFYSEAKHVMYAWAKNQDLHKRYPNQPAKCALTIETLMKRMIEDQNNFPRLQHKIRKGIPNKINEKNEVFENEIEMGVTVEMYNALVLAWAESGLGDAAFERCRQILESMHSISALGESHHIEAEDSSGRIKPNLNTLRNTLYAAAKASTNPGLKAESVLEFATLGEIIKPNAACWDIVLYAWSKSSKTDVESARRAQEILEWMTLVSTPKEGNDIFLSSASQQHSVPTNSKLRPTLQSYRNVVRAWEHSSDAYGGRKAERIAWQGYHQFPHVWDMSTWISVLKAYSRRGNAFKAHQILNACRMHMKEGEHLPNICYALVLNAYAKSPNRSVESAMAAESLLTEMMELDKATDGKVKPNTFCFNIVMQTWSRTNSKGAAKRAEKIFNRMQRLHDKQINEGISVDEDNMYLSEANNGNKEVKYFYRPNAISYHILIRAWSRTRGCKGALKAEKYLDEMESKFMRPNVRTYTLVMNAWSRCPLRECPDGASRAQSILNKMENMYFEGAMPSVKPDKKCYTCVLNAWSRSRQPNKAHMACEVLHKMEHLYQEGNEELKPDLCLYNTVMNTAAFTPYEERLPQQQMDALDITYQTFMDMEKKSDEYGLTPNSVIYCTFLKACRNLMPVGPSRNSVIKAVFGKCCREGLVSGVVLRELKKCCESDEIGLNMWDELISKKRIKRNNDEEAFPVLEELPIEWSRNVKGPHQQRP